MSTLDRIFGVRSPSSRCFICPVCRDVLFMTSTVDRRQSWPRVARDLDALQEAGVDGVLFCNEKDYPYQVKVGVEIAAAMAATVGRLRERIRVPFGVTCCGTPLPAWRSPGPPALRSSARC